jgi:hypothetical protein
MRRHHIVSGILLILPIIDFAVAVPVPVQKKSQASINVVHIPEDAMTMLGKRADDSEYEKLVLELFGVPKSPESSPDRPPSSPPPLAPADGFTNVKLPLPSIPEESSLEPSPSTTSSTEEFSEGEWWDEDENGPMYYPASLGHGSDHELSGVHRPQPDPDLGPSNDPDADWISWTNLENQPPPKRPKPASSKEFGQAQEYQEVQSNPGPSNSGPSDPRLPTEPAPNLGLPKVLDGEVAQGSSPTPDSSDPELHLDHRSLRK